MSVPTQDTARNSGSASSPLPFAIPTCLESVLRCACNACVSVWMRLRSASSDSKRAPSSVTPRFANAAATPGKSLRNPLMSSIERF
mgnify:CR=1 FL=1